MKKSFAPVIALFIASVMIISSCSSAAPASTAIPYVQQAKAGSLTVPNFDFEQTENAVAGDNWTGGLKATGWTVVPPKSAGHTWSAEIAANEESVPGVSSKTLKLTNSVAYPANHDANADYAVRVYTDITGGFIIGTKYEINARIKGDWAGDGSRDPEFGRTQFQVQCFDADGAVLTMDNNWAGAPGLSDGQFAGSINNDKITTERGSWGDYLTVRRPGNEHEIPFTVPTNTATIRVYCWFLGDGTVYLDNIQINESVTPGAQNAVFDASHVFFYADGKDGTGVAAVTPDTGFVNAKGGWSNFSVDFDLYDGETDEPYFEDRTPTVSGGWTSKGEYSDPVVVYPEKKLALHSATVSLSNAVRTANFEYQRSWLTKPKHKYTLVATVWNNSGGNRERVAIFKQNLYVYPRPSIIKTDSDGSFSHFEMDGKVFNPVHTWWAEVGGLQFAKEANINLTVVEYFNVLDRPKLDEYGMKILANAYDVRIPRGDAQAIGIKELDYLKNIVNEWKDDPALFGYVFRDEPLSASFLANEPLEPVIIRMEEGYRTVRELDDVHPVYQCDGSFFEDYFKYCDVFDVDSYPETEAKTVGITRDRIAPAVTAFKGLKPILYLTGPYWFESEKFTWREGGPPTPNVIRNTIYRAFEAGVQGVGYWHFGSNAHRYLDGRGYPLSQTDLWQPIVITNNVEAPLLFDLLVNGKADVIYQRGQGSEPETVFIRQWISQTDGGMYLLAHNRAIAGAAASISIDLKKSDGSAIGSYSAVPVGYTNITKPGRISGTNNISFSLNTSEIALYKIEYDSTVRPASATVNVSFEWEEPAPVSRPVVTFTNGFREGPNTVPAGWTVFSTAPNADILLKSVFVTNVIDNGGSSVHGAFFNAETGKTYDVKFILQYLSAPPVLNLSLKWIDTTPENERPGVTFSNGLQTGTNSVTSGQLPIAAQIANNANGKFQVLYAMVDGVKITSDLNHLALTAVSGRNHYVRFYIGDPSLSPLLYEDFENVSGTEGPPGAVFCVDDYAVDRAWPLNGNASIVVDTVDSARGQVLKVLKNSMDQSFRGLRWTVTGEAGKTYKISGWRRLDESSNGPGIPALVMHYSNGSPIMPPEQEDDTLLRCFLPEMTVPNGQWEWFEVYYTPTTDGIFRIGLLYRPRQNGGWVDFGPGAAYFDDVSVVDASILAASR